MLRIPGERALARLIVPVVLVAGWGVTGCAATVQKEESPRPSLQGAGLADDNLNATLWAQTSAEYAASALQAYVLADIMLQRGLEDPGWSASLEQRRQEGFGDLPPAVILDVDETVLDNSAYQARLIRDGEQFETPSWHAWVREEKALPVPGALEFTRAAADKGVTVFYVTNRRHEVEAATRANLDALGFPLLEGRDVLLTRDERAQWGSDKGTRRSQVAADFRILLLVGDNLGDFVSGIDVGVSERSSVVERHAEMWGRCWIVLPNPQYGSWDGALIDYQYGLPLHEKRRLKREALETARDRPGRRRAAE